MRNAHMGGFGRHHHFHFHPAHEHRGFGRMHREGRGRGRRLFDYGELRLLILSLIADKPRHGYELIKAVEEAFGGGYSPSPGVIYPTLAWLDDMGYAAPQAEAGGRKAYAITPEGEAFLTANRAAVDDILARGSAEQGGRRGAPTQVVRAMENLRTAMRLRLRDRALDDAQAQAIADALDAAAKAIEKA